MRFKAFFIYVGVGIAFLAVSLWVILTAGKNAKAVGAKYKLGGMLIATWAMLSACTCNGPGVGTVTCYDPAPPEQPLCYDVAVMTNEVVLESTTVKKGENFRITIKEPSEENYVARLLSTEGKELQKADLTLEEGSNWDFFFKASENLPAGKAVLVVEFTHKVSDTEEHVEEIFRSEDITIE